MKRVVVINWKISKEHPFEVFSNLKILCESYPKYNYNTLNNYLSKNKMPYENEDVRIERIVVKAEPVKSRQIAMVSKRVSRKTHNEEEQNLQFWLTRPAVEQRDAVTQLRSQVLDKNQRMNKLYGSKRRIR